MVMVVASWGSINLVVSQLSVLGSSHEHNIMVRLITHNLLACHVKGCTTPNNFPLSFNNVQVEIREAELNIDFLSNFFPKIEWNALINAAKQVSSFLTLAD